MNFMKFIFNYGEDFFGKHFRFVPETLYLTRNREQIGRIIVKVVEDKDQHKTISMLLLLFE